MHRQQGIAKATTLGIIGGGQLGRMMTTEALRLGIEVTVIDPGANPPAVQVGAKHIQSGLSDVQALTQLVTENDFVTWEIEHISTDALSEALASATSKAIVEPAVETLAIIQDKLRQKDFLAAANIPVAPYRNITQEADAIDFFGRYPNGIVLKTRTGGYDGRGNYVIKQKADIAAALAHFEGTPLYAEELQDLERELSVIAARGSQGESAVYDPVEMVHENSICLKVSVPTQATAETISSGKLLAQKVLDLLEGKGVFAIEMFVNAAGQVMVNEIAPRVHNSGHHTIEACSTNQFAQHVRAVVGLPLGDPGLVVPQTVMVNILGSATADASEIGLTPDFGTALKQGAAVHWYGKSPVKKDRKMGHITVTGKKDESMTELLQRADAARKVIDV